MMNFRKPGSPEPVSQENQTISGQNFHVPPVPSQAPQPKRRFFQKKRNWILCGVLLLVLAAGVSSRKEHTQTENTEPVASKQEEKLQQEPTPQTPTEAPQEQTEPEPAAQSQQEQTAAPEPASGIRPDVKEAIDSYESFMNEYVSFMIRYEDNEDDTAFLMEYLSLMQKMSDWSETMDSLEKEFTDEENMYFLEAQMRVNGLLLTMPD